MSESATCGLPYTTSQGDLGLGLGLVFWFTANRPVLNCFIDYQNYQSIMSATPYGTYLIVFHLWCESQ